MYIWHDCFLLRTDTGLFVFDFWKMPSPDKSAAGSDIHIVSKGGAEEFGSYMAQLAENRRVYVIVSHHHKDHFNRGVFGWSRYINDIHYIISKDTARSSHYIFKEGSSYSGKYRLDANQITILRPGEIYEDNGVCIHAFGSTDTGNSYVVETEGRSYFHAGDLNAWIWKDESDEQEVRQALCAFKAEVRKIAEQFPTIDYAMFPVDGRIGRDWWEGAGIFARMVDVKNFIPMHFCLYEGMAQRREYIDKATAFSLYANPERGSYCSMTEPFEKLII